MVFDDNIYETCKDNRLADFFGSFFISLERWNSEAGASLLWAESVFHYRCDYVDLPHDVIADEGGRTIAPYLSEPFHYHTDTRRDFSPAGESAVQWLLGV